MNQKIFLLCSDDDFLEKNTHITNNVIIPDAKINKYLLVAKEKNDKSKYLAQGGFYLDNWQDLKMAILELIIDNEAIEDNSDEYGIYYRVIGNLAGVNKNDLHVTTIWQKRHSDNQFYFITLKPYRI